MYTLDPANPFSGPALAALEEFLSYIPPVAVTTAQLRNILNLGVIDAAFMEYQSFAQSPKLADWNFYPFARHDGPLAAVGDVSEEELAALELYRDFLLEAEAQRQASLRFFNRQDEFNWGGARMGGGALLSAQASWKQKKDVLVPAVFYFVFDISGSMNERIEGRTKIDVLVSAVLNNLNHINENNYIGMVSYNDTVYLNMPVVQATPKNKAVMANAVRNLSVGGGTATHDALFVAYDQILNFQQGASRVKPIVLLLSDGEQTSGLSLQTIMPSAYGVGIPVNALGYHISDLGREKLQKLVGVYGEGFEGLGSYTSASEAELDMKLRDMFRSQG
jgi:Ca-activated chloride channel family protein